MGLPDRLMLMPAASTKRPTRFLHALSNITVFKLKPKTRKTNCFQLQQHLDDTPCGTCLPLRVFLLPDGTGGADSPAEAHVRFGEKAVGRDFGQDSC